MASHYQSPPPQRVIFGPGLEEAVAEETERLSARRIVVVVGRSLNYRSGVLDVLKHVLGSSIVHAKLGVQSFSPREDVIDIVNAAGTYDADLIISIGGGSITDAVKIARLCLGNHVADVSGMDRLVVGALGREGLEAPALKHIAIPTTLSSGEYTFLAGGLNTSLGRKQSYAFEGLAPNVVILDGSLACNTPLPLWLSTGLRAVDHAVETWCSINAHPMADATALHALKLLPGALLTAHTAADRADARLQALHGAWLAINGIACGVAQGASHGIGHVLGGIARVPHGFTSCIMLPHVLRFNAPLNAARQTSVRDLIDCTAPDAATAVEKLVTQLGLPGRLRDVGVDPGILDRVAADAMRDYWIPTNPRPIRDVKTIRALLDEAW